MAADTPPRHEGDPAATEPDAHLDLPEHSEQDALDWLRQVGEHIRRGEFGQAELVLAEAAALLPEHPQTLRLRGLLVHLRGDPNEAVRLLRDAHARWPDDAAILNNLGGALRDAGDLDAAIATFRDACEREPRAAACWYNLGVTLAARARNDEAVAAFARALECSPQHLAARIAHADMLARTSTPAQAAAEYRAAIRYHTGAPRAWIGLAELPEVTFSGDELAALRKLAAHPALADEDRIALAFALGHALESRNDHVAAFDALQAANAERRRQSAWDGTMFSTLMDALQQAFTPGLPAAVDGALGSEVIFVVGLPCSGAADVIASLAAHSEVGLGDGSPQLVNVIQEESARRNAEFPQWVHAATADDWQRLGRRYLAVTTAWRRNGSHHVDIALGNWPFLGAALAMLPGAHVIDCRRDALDAGWACWRQLFMPGRELYAYAFDDIARHRHDYECVLQFWQARHPQAIQCQEFEGLLTHRAASIRAVLDFCGLRFEPDCVSARSDADRGSAYATAEAYGYLAEPLRQALDTGAKRDV